MFSGYERRDEPLAPLPVFLRRVRRNLLVVLGFVAFSLILGTLGYHYLGELAWIDAFLDASMILAGMGPVNPITATAGKLFAAFYALYSGITFLSLVAFCAAPIYHRMLHHFHLQTESDEDKKGHGRRGGS